ncbi:hypothetical protein H7849_23370 [Alloacidobacterium dinghuense]|uniref:DUF4239 domain-containing protein n=1 Tax=Alloacidobacterium dinghuense TaxID=2763107 RepID=A0A7G8BHB0_9BACT|nr:hypothetical protein [Alloacidobacterium dinghuense]QNI31930.1 hypothetical protein H7849_23370 [Alloacidobacterium dinghuense]
MFHFPFEVFFVSLIVLWLSVQLGSFFGKLRPIKEEDDRSDLDLVISASLTMLALIIGFTFSMAVSRYDQRKNYEEEEANAIGTEYVRADLLPAADGAKVRQLLTQYLDQRLLFYTTRDQEQLQTIDNQTAKLQNEMWSAVQTAATTQPNPVTALAVAGMNDVLNRQGYTQAAWWNRIPVGAWSLMTALAICCSILIGYGAHRRKATLFGVLPFLVAIAFFLISDIDSPGRGIIQVAPQNLISLSQSLHSTQ